MPSELAPETKFTSTPTPANVELNLIPDDPILLTPIALKALKAHCDNQSPSTFPTLFTLIDTVSNSFHFFNASYPLEFRKTANYFKSIGAKIAINSDQFPNSGTNTLSPDQLNLITTHGKGLFNANSPYLKTRIQTPYDAYMHILKHLNNLKKHNQLIKHSSKLNHDPSNPNSNPNSNPDAFKIAHMNWIQACSEHNAELANKLETANANWRNLIAERAALDTRIAEAREELRTIKSQHHANRPRRPLPSDFT